jgi:transposase
MISIQEGSMVQSGTSKSEQAEERSADTKSFVRQIRSATRRKYTSEEKIRIVLEGFRRDSTVNELCRREGIKPNSFYSWTKDFLEAGKQRLSRDTLRDATQQEIEQLKREKAELKQLVAELSLEAFRLKKVAVPYPESVSGTSG